MSMAVERKSASGSDSFFDRSICMGKAATSACALGMPTNFQKPSRSSTPSMTSPFGCMQQPHSLEPRFLMVANSRTA
jgi:hypothetical protein